MQKTRRIHTQCRGLFQVSGLAVFTSLNTKYAVDRAEVNKGRHNQNDANPTPNTDCASDRENHQQRTNDKASDAVNAAHVFCECHVFSPFVCLD
jgi:hypothetical protein